MVVFNNALAGAAGQAGGAAAAGYEIERSLRFNSGDSAYLSKNFTSAGNRKTWTISTWVKRGKLGTFQAVFGSRPGATPWSVMLFRDTDKLEWDTNTGFGDFTTTQVFRDPSAWYHIVLAIDSTQGPVADSVKLYVNGERITTFDSISYPTLNQEGDWNTAVAHNIGAQGPPTYGDYGDFYQADFHFIDGLALPASAFGEPDANGVWQPKQYINPNNGTTWSNYVTGTALTGYEATKAFDGDLSTQAIPDRTGTTTPTTLTFTPPSAISGKVGIYFLANTNEDDSATISINGTDVSSTLRAVQAAGGSQPWYYEFDSITSLSSIAWTAETGFDGWNVFGITIDGMLLVDGWNQYNDGTFYSNGATATGGFESANPAPNGFNGVITAANRANGVTTGGTIEIVFNPGIAVTSTVGIWSGKSGLKYQINDSGSYTSYTDAVEAWKDISFSGTLTNLKIQHASSNEAPGFSGIRVDGTTLVDTGTVGRNSFHLKFDDATSTTTIAEDSSGNNNDWTANNIYVSPDSAETFTLLGDSSSPFPAGTSATNISSLSTLATNTKNFTTHGTYQALTADFGSVGSHTITFYLAPNSDTNHYISDDGSTWTSYTRPASVGPQTFTGRYIQFARTNATFPYWTIDSSIPDNWLYTDVGADNDSLFDSPTNGDPSVDTGLGGELSGNYATWNPLDTSRLGASLIPLSNGNLDTSATSAAGEAVGSMALNGGKYYFELTLTTADNVPGANSHRFGICRNGSGSSSDTIIYNAVGDFETFGTQDTAPSQYQVGDTIGCAVDGINGSIQFFKNGTSEGTKTFTVGSDLWFPWIRVYWTGGTVAGSINFGQRPFANSSVPSGFKSLCTANLPTPDIADGSTAMDVVTYDGNGTSQTISGLGFEPDLVWIKARSASNSHVLQDAVRGFGSSTLLSSNDAAKENSATTPTDGAERGYISAATSSGFSVVNGTGTPQVNGSSVTYVAWAWDANEPPTANNSAGAGNVPTAGSVKIDGVDLTSALPGTLPVTRMAVNRTAGFSVFSYTGTGTTQTIYHGLDKQPDMLIVKCRSDGKNWAVWHSGLTQPASGNGYYLIMNGAASPGTDGENNVFPYWYSTSFNSSTFTLGNTGGSNELNATFIGYAFSAIPGYSSFGKYTGNGATGWPNADGPFVYTGMRPRWIMVKCTSQSEDWLIYDSARDTYNYADEKIRANSSAIAASVTNHEIDILSNGFKVRNNNGGWNQNGATYIYAAFAETPQKFARAR